VATGTFGLGFVTLPVVFAHMGAWGNVIGALWFFMLFLAAITSSLSMLQPAQAFFEEALGVDRGLSTTLVSAVCVLGNLFVMYFSAGLTALDTIDFWVGTFMIFVMATVQIITFGWIFGVDRGLEEARAGAHIRIPRSYRLIIKYVTPLYLIVVFVGFCVQNVPGYVRALFGADGQPANTVALYSWGVILASLVLLLVLVVVGSRRWRAQGLDLDGQLPPADGR
jgi:SNF family Na+-dependent transporter